jgi:sugar phosphate isomerase/epimerase
MNDIATELPFRIGTSSYIYPDNIIPNVRKLKDRVDDIELVLFEVRDKSNIPSRQELNELARIAGENSLSYTAHMPLDIDLGGISKNKRLSSVEKVTELMEYLSVLEPYAHILHLNLSTRTKEDISLWQDRVNDSLRRILEKAKIDSTRVAIENLDYHFIHVESIIDLNRLSVCIDIGHLINMRFDVRKHLAGYLKKTRVIHLHGVNKGRDHTSLKYLDKKLIKDIWKLLKDNDYCGVLTLEVFSERDFEESMSVLNQLIKGS